MAAVVEPFILNLPDNWYSIHKHLWELCWWEQTFEGLECSHYIPSTTTGVYVRNADTIQVLYFAQDLFWSQILNFLIAGARDVTWLGTALGLEQDPILVPHCYDYSTNTGGQSCTWQTNNKVYKLCLGNVL